ncbi:MAG: glycosyltransferase [Thermoguttaceae bacterium]
MNILHVIQGLDRITGGPAYAIRHLTACQRDMGAKVKIAATTVRARSLPDSTPDDLEAYRLEPAFCGVELHFCRPLTLGPVGRTWGFVPGAQTAMDNLYRSEELPDVVHIHGVFSAIAMEAAQWARRRRIPYVCRPAGSVNQACLRMGRAWLKHLYLRMCYVKDLRHASMLHAASFGEAHAIRTLVPDAESAIRIIPHGVEVGCCDRQSFRRSFFTEYPQLAGRRIALFLSRVTAKKRPEMFLEAAARMRRNRPDLAAVIVGSGDCHEKLLRQAIDRYGMRDCVLRLQHLDGRERCQAFAAADVFVLPSLDENFGLAVVEAMAHGVAAVVTRGVATHQYVDECCGGVTVDDSPESLAVGMERVLYGDLQNAGGRARDYVMRKLTWQASAQQLMQEYEIFRSNCVSTRAA